MILYIIYQYGWELVVIHQILIVFKAILENFLFNFLSISRTIYVSESDSGKPLLLATIFKFQLVGPLSAEGFYDVNRGLLVALTGTLLTYIIILVQMKDLFQWEIMKAPHFLIKKKTYLLIVLLKHIIWQK